MPCLVIIVGSRRLLNTWYSSQPGLGDSSFKPTPMPTGRTHLAAAPLGVGVVGVFGGWGGSGTLPTNEAYSLDTNTWSTKAPMPTARAYLAAAELGDGVAGTLGGSGSGTGMNFNEVYLY